MHRVTVVAMVAMMIWVASFLVSVLLTLFALDEGCLSSIPSYERTIYVGSACGLVAIAIARGHK